MYNTVVAALEACINTSNEGDCVTQGCPYYQTPECVKKSSIDTLKVLKELKAENDRYKEVIGTLVVRDNAVVTVLAGKETKYVSWGISQVLQDLARKSGREKALEELSKMLLDTKIKVGDEFMIYADNINACLANLQKNTGVGE